MIFDFAHRIDEELENSLRKMNICVRIDGKNDNIDSEINTNFCTNILNLDVTTMMALVSNLTRETCDWTFDNPILNDQARREQIQSTKLVLDEFFNGI